MVKCFDTRSVFVTSLIVCNDIPYTIAQLIEILEMIKTMNTETIRELFKSKACDWMKQAIVFIGKELNTDDEMK